MTPPKASFQPLSGPRALRAFGERRALAGGIHRTLSWLIATPPSQVYSRRGGGRGLAPVAATVATPVDPGPRSPSLTSAVTGVLLTLHVYVSRRFWQSASAWEVYTYRRTLGKYPYRLSPVFWHISHNISRYMVRLHPKNQANIAIYLYASRHTTAVSQVYCNYSRTDTYFSSNCSRQNAPEYTHSVTDHSLCAHTHTFSQS